jgi:hypothetical protein
VFTFHFIVFANQVCVICCFQLPHGYFLWHINKHYMCLLTILFCLNFFQTRYFILPKFCTLVYMCLQCT